jgi:hypothetical protein
MSDDEQAEDERPRELRHRGPERASPYPVSRLSGPVSLVDAAREIERADQWIASTSESKLVVIAAQMHALRQQAEQVLAEARQNATLHRAEARFQRHPGKTYHLYERVDRQRYWSMLAPVDWNGQPPHAYVGSYRLEADQSWTPLERTAERDLGRQPVSDWLERRLLTDAGPTGHSRVEPRAATPAATRPEPTEDPAVCASEPPAACSSERKEPCESS